MKYWLVYWLVGSIIVGISWGAKVDECEGWVKQDPVKLVATVAIWPVLIVALNSTKFHPISIGCRPAGEA